LDKVLIADYPFASVDIETGILAQDGVEVVAAQCVTDEDAIPLAADAVGMIHSSCPITRRLLEAAPKCVIVAHYGVGVDNIDVAAATELGILVTNVPDYCVDEVSDHAMALLLACARRIVTLDAIVRSGSYDYQKAGIVHRLRGQTLGLVGLGRIGQGVVAKAKGFGLHVVCHDPYVSEEQAAQSGVRLVGFEELLDQSDFISLHVPLTESTANLFGEAQFRRMKPSAYLINTSRRGLVDAEALRRALTEGWIAGMGNDTIFDGIPYETTDPLLAAPNLIASPHAGWYSEESKIQLRREAADEVARVLRGEKPYSPINPKIWEQSRAHTRAR
jgi:D-3-phosphoglycerate dehydrogenase